MAEGDNDYVCCGKKMIFQPSQQQFHCPHCKNTKHKQNSLLRDVKFESSKSKTNPSR